MTTTTGLSVLQALRRAAVRATLAPSVHNTQPWQLVLSGHTLEFHLEPTRTLPVLDPLGRQARISCGCALFNARVALAARGHQVQVQRLPEPTQPGLLARLIVSGDGELESDIALLDRAIEQRHTNRRRFSTEPVPWPVVDRLTRAAAAESTGLWPIHNQDQLITTAVLSQRANALQAEDPAYRAELRAWTTDQNDRRDGVPVKAVPAAMPISHDEVPLRNFDTTGKGELPAEIHSTIGQCLLLLSSMNDDPMAWLRAGEALQRALLTLTDEGYVAGLFSQLAEIPAIRAQLREQLDTIEFPHLLLRVGRADVTPATRRRRLADVLVEKF